MSATLLSNELTTLISDAKRKNGDLRTAAEKSLQELKSLPNTSEQQLAADLRRRPAFIEPFILACTTRNPKFAGSGVSCLQRLVVSKGLPKARLEDALDAFNSCTELGLEVQLKILQALPSLLQNYADDLQGSLLASALQVCASLQSAKVQTVSGVAAATLQQLVTAVFEKVLAEDKQANAVGTVAEVPGRDEAIALRPAAHDAFRVFRDLVLTAEGRKTKFVDLPTLTPESSLDLLFSCIQGNERLFQTHLELTSVIRSNLLPLVTRALSEKLAFPITLRSMRMLDLLLVRYFSMYYEECEAAFGLVAQNLEPDAAAPWKRSMVMEVVRNFFAQAGLVQEAYACYDLGGERKTIIQDILAAFVRVSAEKPAVIGLGQQSTTPFGRNAQDQVTVEAAGGMAGVISSALGVSEANTVGISSQWSLPRTACLEHLDKVDAPNLPETYVYTLILDCLSSLSDGLARMVLPLTIRQSDEDSAELEKASAPEASADQAVQPPRPRRTNSSRHRSTLLDPAGLADTSKHAKVRTVIGLVENCWPAVLATSSTFLNAALEETYYRGLIKAYQRFTQVAGLLRLNTARDALMTTLSKSAIPPHVLNAAHNDGMRSPVPESPRVFSSSKGMLSVDSLVSQAASLTMDRERRISVEPSRPILTTRNLLCLRALLNLAIALGPTLDTAFAVVVDALRQADFILSTTGPHMRRASASAGRADDSAVDLQAFSTEVASVEGAASRLLESTVDYPDEAFVNVLRTFTRLLEPKAALSRRPSEAEVPSSPASPLPKGRTFSGLPGISTLAEMQARDYKFVVPKLGSLAELNLTRFATHDTKDSGWNLLIEELVVIATDAFRPRDARRASTDVLCNLTAQSIVDVSDEDDHHRATVQRRALAVLLQLVDGVYAGEGDLVNTDLEIQGHVLEALHSILEQSGESLVAGWNKVIAIISSAFERTEPVPLHQAQDTETRIEWKQVTSDFVSLQIGKAAFAATQLVCSDFQAVLPVAVIPSLIELLYRFTSQTRDLNVALATITITWNVSDFLFQQAKSQGLDTFSESLQGVEDVDQVVSRAASSSRPAQVMFLLHRMRDAVQQTQKEVRNAAFQTVCSIFKSHGRDLSSRVWREMLRSVVLMIPSTDVRAIMNNKNDTERSAGKEVAVDYEMSKTIIIGTSKIMAHSYHVLECLRSDLWEVYLKTMEAYIELGTHLLNAAVYNAILRILRRIPDHSGSEPVYSALALWLRRVPEQVKGKDSEDEQEAFLAYAETGTELHRLTKQTIASSQIRKMIDNVFHCVQHSNGPSHGADTNNMSPVQAKVLALLKAIRLPNKDDIHPRLIFVASRMSTMHHDSLGVERSKNGGPTFVAVACEALEWLGQLIISHLRDSEVTDMADTVAILSGMQGLRRVIAAKYDYPAECKGIPLWRRATDTALEIAELVRKHADTGNLSGGVTRQQLWDELIAISAGIIGGKGMEMVDGTAKIYKDEIADIASFSQLRQVLVPGLGDRALSNDVRDLYCRSLFDASIVHALERSESFPLNNTSPLDMVNRTRRGRVKHVPFSNRERICYVCFRELIVLASVNASSEENSVLAQAAAPYLILRLAIPIRAYSADQPLRGQRPQPLSELEELLFCFDEIKKLELHPHALPGTSTASAWGPKRAHLPFLYPLLTQAVAVAGDRWCGTEEVFSPLQSVLEATAKFVQ